MVNPQQPIVDVRSQVNPTEEQPGGGTGTPPPIVPAGSGGTGTGTPPGGGSSSSSSSSVVTKKTTTTEPVITSTVPEEFKGSGYGELIPWLEDYLKEHKPMSKEELEKLRKKQRAEGIISGIADAAQAVSNLVFTSQYAPNMYDAKDGLSAKLKARLEKEKAERDADTDKFFNYAMTYGKLKNDEKQQGLKAWETEQTLARQDRAHDEGRQDRADDVAFRDKDFDTRVAQWQANFDREGEWHEEQKQQWERQFKESVRQFNVSSSLEQQRIGIEAQRLAQQVQQNQMTFNLGNGNGNVTLSLDKLNAQTVSRIYSTLPANVRSQVQGDPIVQNGFVVGYKAPTTEAMLIAIGANVQNSPDTQAAIREVASGKKGRGY